MSQQVTEVPEVTDDEQTALATAISSELSVAKQLLSSLDGDDVHEMSDENIVELRQSLKELEDIVDDVRKDVVETELENRVEPGESLLGLKRIQSHNKFVDDDVESVIMRAVGAGVDYTDFVDLDASTLASDYPELAEIGRYEYTYFR